MMSTGPPNALVVGCVSQPVVPDVDVVGGDIGCDGGADVGEPVELFFAEVRRQFGSHGALRLAVTAEGAKRRDHLVGQLRAAQRDRGEQHQSANAVGVLCGDQFGDLGAEALADDDHRSVDSLRAISPASAASDSSVTLHASATDPLRVPNPGRS